jgi:membrane protein implicated in regulation of membrane protease activity
VSQRSNIINYDEVYRVMRRPKPTGLKGCLMLIVTILAGIATRGWMFMLLLGILHSNLTWLVPNWGFWTSTVSILLLRGVFYWTIVPRKEEKS